MEKRTYNKTVLVPKKEKRTYNKKVEVKKDNFVKKFKKIKNGNK